jgi:hypothetical protein
MTVDAGSVERPQVPIEPAAKKRARELSVSAEVKTFETTKDKVDLGNLRIRERFAFHMVLLFVGANVFVMTGLGFVFWQDCKDLSSGLIKPNERVITSSVVMALLGATTIQLGTVIYTIARSIFRVAKEDTQS